MEKPLKDSGERKVFETGAVRDTSRGKGRFDLLQWLAIITQAKHLEKGAFKYDDRNWEKGMSLSRMMDSGIRHAIMYFIGLKDEEHLDAAIWNLLGARELGIRIELGLLPEDLDDIPYLLEGVDEEKIKKYITETFGMSVQDQEESTETPTARDDITYNGESYIARCQFCKKEFQYTMYSVAEIRLDNHYKECNEKVAFKYDDRKEFKEVIG